MPYKPGQSGNLSGHPRTLDRYIRAQTSDVIEIADFYLGLFRDASAKLDTRITAANWLTDRAIGTAVQRMEDMTERGDGRPLVGWTVEKLEAAIKLLDRAEAIPAEQWREVPEATLRSENTAPRPEKQS